MKLHRTLIIAILLFCLCQIGCNKDGEELNFAVVIKDGIKYYVQTDKYNYQPGDKVEILFRITNTTNEKILVGDWPDLGAIRPVYIKKGDNDIYRVPSTPYEITEYYLKPHESCEYEMVWEMLTWPEDQPVAPGSYTVVAELDGAVSVLISVTIEIQGCAKEGEMFSAVYPQYPAHCCDGLVEWNSGFDTRVSIGDACYETGLVAGAPVGTCINCGNNICDDIEDACNCPNDCLDGDNSDYANVDEFCSSEFWTKTMASVCKESLQNNGLPICALCE